MTAFTKSPPLKKKKHILYMYIISASHAVRGAGGAGPYKSRERNDEEYGSAYTPEKALVSDFSRKYIIKQSSITAWKRCLDNTIMHLNSSYA